MHFHAVLTLVHALYIFYSWKLQNPNPKPGFGKNRPGLESLDVLMCVYTLYEILHFYSIYLYLSKYPSTGQMLTKQMTSVMASFSISSSLKFQPFSDSYYPQQNLYSTSQVCYLVSKYR